MKKKTKEKEKRVDKKTIRIIKSILCDILDWVIDRWQFHTATDSDSGVEGRYKYAKTLAPIFTDVLNEIRLFHEKYLKSYAGDASRILTVTPRVFRGIDTAFLPIFYVGPVFNFTHILGHCLKWRYYVRRINACTPAT